MDKFFLKKILSRSFQQFSVQICRSPGGAIPYAMGFYWGCLPISKDVAGE
jgi:hypothetical protein